MGHVEIGTVSPQKKWLLYQSSKAVLNLFRKTTVQAASPNPRVFEVTALGRPALLTGFARREVNSIFGDSIYQFTNFRTLRQQLELALSDSKDRKRRVREAQKIAIASHLYIHRAQVVLERLNENYSPRVVDGFPKQKNIYWIFGAGRTGSTWLLEMLAAIPRICAWNEPYFGQLIRDVQNNASQLTHKESFFAPLYDEIWKTTYRRLFLEMSAIRFPWREQDDKLVVKDVNASELAPLVPKIFPQSRFILIVRDPFDVFDSYLDMQKKGAWNEKFVDGFPFKGNSEEQTAKLIKRLFQDALDGYALMPSDQRTTIRFEDLLRSPVKTFGECCAFIGFAPSQKEIRHIVEAYRFNKYARTGTLAFRRYGKAGLWRSSPNFTKTVRLVARTELGPLRKLLGYA